MKNVLLGREATTTISGLASGYLRDFTVSGTVDIVDASGIGTSGAGYSGAPFREKVITFSNATAQFSGITETGTGLDTPGAEIAIATELLSFNAIVNNTSEQANYDGLVTLSVSAEASN